MAVAPTDPFERLYRRYARDVYRFALSVVRNPSEAEDVTRRRSSMRFARTRAASGRSGRTAG
jgi:hypothetical protein